MRKLEYENHATSAAYTTADNGGIWPEIQYVHLSTQIKRNLKIITVDLHFSFAYIINIDKIDILLNKNVRRLLLLLFSNILTFHTYQSSFWFD